MTAKSETTPQSDMTGASVSGAKADIVDCALDRARALLKGADE